MKTLAIIRKMTAISVTYRFRRSRGKNENQGHIQVCIKIKDFDYSPLTYKHNVEKSVWDAINEPKKAKSKEIQFKSIELKKELDEFVNTIRATYVLLSNQEQEIITAHDLVYYNTKTSEIQKKKIEVSNLSSLIDDFIEKNKEKVLDKIVPFKIKNKITKGTFRNYKKYQQKINDYLSYSKQKYVSIHNVDLLFIEGLEKYLDAKYSTSYTAKIIKFVIQIMDYAVNCRYVKVNYLNNYKTFSGIPSEPFNIPEEDINKIEFYQFYDSVERRYVNAWLLARELALHFIDYADLKNENINLKDFYEIENMQKVFHFDQIPIKKKQKVYAFQKVRVKSKIFQNSIFTPRAVRMFEYFDKNVLMMPLNGKYSSITSFSKILRPALQKALNSDVNYVFSHARDSMIYHLLRMKSHDRFIMAIAGWRSLDELHRYARVDNQILFDSKYYSKSA